jgi:hypothetical protein
MNFVIHAAERLAERGISLEDIDLALARTDGPPVPGSGMTIVTVGYARGGRRLKVVRSSADTQLVISAYWLD